MQPFRYSIVLERYFQQVFTPAGQIPPRRFKDPLDPYLVQPVRPPHCRVLISPAANPGGGRLGFSSSVFSGCSRMLGSMEIPSQLKRKDRLPYLLIIPFAGGIASRNADIILVCNRSAREPGRY
jgi:hypothetical protein